jgi:hypothetical protein
MKEQVTLKHSRTNQSSGKPMGKIGQGLSLLASLGNNAKGHGTKETGAVNTCRPASWTETGETGPARWSVTRIGTDTYSVSWIRPEGRSNSYSDKSAKNEIVRTVSIRTTTDLVDHWENITDRPTTIVVDILGPKVVFPKA